MNAYSSYAENKIHYEERIYIGWRKKNASCLSLHETSCRKDKFMIYLHRKENTLKFIFGKFQASMVHE